MGQIAIERRSFIHIYDTKGTEEIRRSRNGVHHAEKHPQS